MGDEYLKDVKDQLEGMDEASRKEAAAMAQKAEEMDKALSGYRDNKAFFVKAISIIAIIFALFHFYTGGFGMFTAIRQRAIHLLFALWICFMKYSSNKNKGPKTEPWLPYLYLAIMLMGIILVPICDYAKKARVDMTGAVIAIVIVFLAAAFISRIFTLKARIKANKEVEDQPMWYDYIFMICGAIGCIYMAINTDLILQRAGIVYPIDQIMGLFLLICTIEATRRSIGHVLMCIGIFMLLYCRFGFLCGGIWNHPGFSLPMIIRHFVLTDAALWGTPIGVSASYISLFLLLGAALHATGLAELLLKVAKGLVGHFVGGPAKMAVVASSMFAMISGSSTSNVATTGVITIPLMKKTGIPAALAGATEAAASMGGQVTPPVMGAVAFIMAEFLGISYVKIICAAAIPALLYYVSVFTMIHFEAHKIGAWGLRKSEIPEWKHDALTKGYLIIPVVVLVYMLVKGYTAMASCFYSFLLAIAISFFRKDTRLNLKKFLGIFDQAGQTLCVVAVPSAIAGFVEGTATLTGLTPAITKVLTDLSHSNMILTLIITMAMCLVLGMGVPTVANYILMTIMTVPTMISVGVMPLAAHLFCFYFGIMSELTPPVAITSYTASAIAGAPFWPTAFNAVRLAAVAYIVPYIFVFNTSLLLGTQPFEFKLIFVIITAALGSLSFAIGMAGFIRRKMYLIERFLICGFALLLIHPGSLTDIMGFAGIGLIFAMQWIYKKNPKNYVPPVKPEGY